jgi:ABC-type multidrug transport system ATPase subunit
VILEDVSVTVFPGEMVALMGPSGAGKTTLLEVLTGQRRPSSGSVLVNGIDLHNQRASIADRIGYVPQEDVMHRDLTVFEVLHYAARLRLPSDLPDAAVRDHVERLLTRMGLAHIRDTLIGGENVRGVSGGQRKRVNIALELLTEPPLLFLDEPTSGLDATSTLEVLSVLRGLADEGKTILMTIHQPRIEAFRLMDMLLLLAKGGKLAYFGPGAPGAAEYFGARSSISQSAESNPADYALDVLDPANESAAKPPSYWQSEYRNSTQHKSYVTSRAGDTKSAEIQPPRAAFGRRRSFLSQTITLTQRIVARKARDATALTLQVLQPVIVGGLLAWIFHEVEVGDMKWPVKGADAADAAAAMIGQATPDLQAANKIHAVLFLVAATAFWLGCSNVARELVAERPVFRRERMAGLSTLAYLSSTFVVQAVIGLAQVTVLSVMVWAALPLSSSVLAGTAIAWLTLASGIGVGMLISATVRSEVTAISSLPLLLLPQLMLAGYLQLYRDLSDPLKALAAITPVRWAFSALIALEYEAAEPLYKMSEAIGFDEAIEIAPSILLTSVVILLGATYARLATTSSSTGS